jgi:AraC-like DNA-binding protein
VNQRLAARGGFPGWQQKKLTQYIEEHLADEVSLLSLAQVAQLSPSDHLVGDGEQPGRQGGAGS